MHPRAFPPPTKDGPLRGWTGHYGLSPTAGKSVRRKHISASPSGSSSSNFSSISPIFSDLLAAKDTLPVNHEDASNGGIGSSCAWTTDFSKTLHPSSRAALQRKIIRQQGWASRYLKFNFCCCCTRLKRFFASAHRSASRSPNNVLAYGQPFSCHMANTVPLVKRRPQRPTRGSNHFAFCEIDSAAQGRYFEAIFVPARYHAFSSPAREQNEQDTRWPCTHS